MRDIRKGIRKAARSRDLAGIVRLAAIAESGLELLVDIARTDEGRVDIAQLYAPMAECIKTRIEASRWHKAAGGPDPRRIKPVTASDILAGLKSLHLSSLDDYISSFSLPT